MMMRVALVVAVLGRVGVLARPTVRELRTPEEYETLVRHHKEKTGLPVIVDFYSDSCGPCRMIAPAFKRLGLEYKDRAVLAKVNIQSNPVAQSFHFYLNGKKVNELHGAAEAHLKDLAHKIVVDAEKANVQLTLASLEDFYASADGGKSSADVEKIYKKCASLSNTAGTCTGTAARELAKKLASKFGSAPALSKRGAKADEKRKHPHHHHHATDAYHHKTQPVTLQTSTTEDLVAELERRGNKGDDLAAVLAEAAGEYHGDDEDEAEAEADLFEEGDDDDDDALPKYRPPKNPNFVERVVILGAGPAGLAAAVYAARSGLAPIVVAPPGGGQLLGKGVTIENYPGLEGETGPSLVTRMQRHAAEYGAVFFEHRVTRAFVGASPFVLETDAQVNLTSHTLIVTTGADSRWLGVPGEHDFRGAGVSSCATCDGFVYRDHPVAVVGGGDAAMEDALVLARTSSHVTVIHWRDAFRATKVLADRVLHHPRITVLWNTTVIAFEGLTVDTADNAVAAADEDDDEEDDEDPPVTALERLKLRNVQTHEASDLEVRGCFIAIGHDPNTAIFDGQFDRYPDGYLKLAPGHAATALSVSGAFAAGDAADDTYRQAITSAGSGAAAALDAERWLSERGISDDFELEVMSELNALYNGDLPDVADTPDADAKSEL